jgi:hypothetical protein
MSEKCQQDDFIFILPHGSKIIEVYYKEETKEKLADRYMGKSAKDAKTAFENIKKFQSIPLPTGLKTYCDCTGKPCDPDSWFCHRNFAAIRYLKDKRFAGTNKGCISMKWRD